MVYFSRVGNTDFQETIDADSSASIRIDENGPMGNAGQIAAWIADASGAETMEILTGFRIPILIMLGALVLILLLALLIIANIRTALKEVGRGEPFSERCSQALNTAATLEVISGLIGIAISIYAAFIFGGISVDGGTAVHFTTNLSFILIAILLKMLAGVSEFGRE